MIYRAILAVLAATLSAPVLAGQLGPAYDQAMAAGQNANTSYDGSTARAALQEEVAGAQTPGGLAVEPAQTASRASLAADVPGPEKSETKGGFFSNLFTKRNLLFSAGGAAVGAGAGWLFGGPFGAIVGAAAGALVGLGIGFLLSKILHKR